MSWAGEEYKESDPSPAEGLILSPATILDDGSETKSTEPPQAAPLAIDAITNPRRRRTYGQRRVSEDHKRERNRATFRRFYQRKQQTLRELREEEEQLAEQYQQLKLSRQEIAESPDSARPDASLVRLISHKDKLLAEQSVLQQVVQEQLRTRRQLGRLADAFEDDVDQDLAHLAASSHLLPPLNYSDAFLNDAIRRLCDLEPSSECSQVEDAFGWRCLTRPFDDHMLFHITKQFEAPLPSIEEIARGTWEFYSVPKSSGRSAAPAQLIAPSSQVRMCRRVLSAFDQELRSSRLVFRLLARAHSEPYERTRGSSVDDADDSSAGGDEEHSRSNRPLRMSKAVYVVTLMPLDASSGSFAVVSHAVNNQEAYDTMDSEIYRLLGDLDDPYVHDEFLEGGDDLSMRVGAASREIVEEWMEENCWWRIEPSASGVQISLSGRANACMGLSPRACFMEVLRVAVQWEHAVLNAPPILCLDP